MDRQSWTYRRASSPAAAGADLGRMSTQDKLTRRRIFKGVAGAAAFGAATGSVLAQASPASAATTTEPGAVAPAVISLTDAATIARGSGYEFSEGLPQPTLSTKAGQTDLLGFIYHAAKGRWLLAAFVNGFD